MKLTFVAMMLLPACAWAAPRESVTFSNTASNGVLGSPQNTVLTHTFAGGYGLGRVAYSGTLTSLQPLTWSSDCRVEMVGPGGVRAVIQPVSSGSTFSTVSFSGSIFVPGAADPAGVWSFRFYESFDDAGTAVDARVNITVTFTDEPPAPPAAVDLGILNAPGRTVPSFDLSPASVAWFRVRVHAGVRVETGTFLDLNTLITRPDAIDSRVGVYDAAGTLVAWDDDSGPSLASQLSFGVGGGSPIGDGQPRDGRDGGLEPGTYYIAVGPRLTTFGPLFWNARSTETGFSSYSLLINTNLCRVDYNGDGFLDFFDYDDFVFGFETGDPRVDFNDDGFLDFFDYDEFVAGFESGC